MLTCHKGNILDGKIFIKIGGDHGQQSMKFAFQLANLPRPNSSKNTVVFCLYEAKDNRNNLRTALKHYKDQLAELKQEKVL